MILHLDSSFNPQPEKQQIKFEAFCFSGGEAHIKILSTLEDVSEVTISHRVKSFNDFGLLLVAVDALKGMGIWNISLILPYFPGARQDRRMIPGEALTVKVYADIINSLELDQVIIFDPHSEVTPALLNRCKVINNHQFIEEVMKSLPANTILISPDGGALKKVYKLAAYLQNYEVIECSKSRNVKTGELSGFQVYCTDLAGRDCIIIDDICDGGGTFLGLAEKLKAKNAGHLHLAISHGIFNRGTEELSKKFRSIHCTNSFKNIQSTENLHQYPLTLK